jgi:predicted ATPase
MNDLNPTIILGASGTGTTIILNELVNPVLATVTGVLTILILSQKLYVNWKIMREKK